MNDPKVFFRVHAVQRMFERNVAVRSVTQAIQSGKIVEDYSSEMPEPGRLLLGFQGNSPVHVVISENQQTNELTIITVYRPAPGKWNKDFMRRRS